MQISSTPILSFEEITSSQQFEELVASYFRLLKKENSSLLRVEVRPPSVGADGGRDILVDFLVTDSIVDFNRRWIVQCKFHNHDVSTKHISDINIPSLIHSYNADGYLLICKKGPTTKLTAMFERLNYDCQMKYKYQIWSGDQLKSQLLATDEIIYKTFFPVYYSRLQTLTLGTI